jgi:hypothetical protein
MAIEKIKRASKTTKRQAVEHVEAAPNLEAKRQLFQEVASSKKPVDTISSVAESETKALPKHHTASKRTLMIIVAAAAAVIATSICAYAYFWYQNPEKIVLDAIVNAASSKSTQYSGKMYLLKSEDPQVSFNGVTNDGVGQINTTVKLAPSGEVSTLNASAIFDHNDLYAKIDKASLLVQNGPSDIKKTLAPYTSVIQQKVDNKWIKVNPGDLNDFKSVTFVSQCMVDVIKELTTNRSTVSGLIGAYQKSPFFNATESTKPADSVGEYSLQLDSGRFDKFRQDFVRSKAFASLAGCSAANDMPTGAQLSGMEINLTINKAERQIIHITVKNDKQFISKISIDPIFNTSAPVTVPHDAQTLNDIKAIALKDYVSGLLKQLK